MENSEDNNKNQMLLSLGFSKEYLSSLREYEKNNFIQVQEQGTTDLTITFVDIYTPDIKLVSPVGNDSTDFYILQSKG